MGIPSEKLPRSGGRRSRLERCGPASPPGEFKLKLALVEDVGWAMLLLLPAGKPRAVDWVREGLCRADEADKGEPLPEEMPRDGDALRPSREEEDAGWPPVEALKVIDGAVLELWLPSLECCRSELSLLAVSLLVWLTVVKAEEELCWVVGYDRGDAPPAASSAACCDLGEDIMGMLCK